MGLLDGNVLSRLVFFIFSKQEEGILLILARHGQWGMFTCTKLSVAPENSLAALGMSIQDELFPVKYGIFL